MKLRTLISIFLIFFCKICVAEQYGFYDSKSILLAKKTGEGEKYSLDIQAMDRIINDLAAHARYYPPKFESEQEKQRAIQDTQVLSGILETLVSKPDANPELLKRSGFVNSIGHNLDIKGCAQKADRDFKSYLARKPDDPSVNFMYGAFLGGANQGDRALPYLEKAASLEYTDAYYSLGMYYLSKNDRDSALKNFEIYKSHSPKDESIAKLIEAVKSGKFEFKRE